jgi:cytochrome c553
LTPTIHPVPKQWLRRVIRIALLGLSLAAAQAYAVDAFRGKTLYSSTPPGGGAPACSTSGCHNANAAAGANGLSNGKNNPSIISAAIASGKGGMGLLQNKWQPADIADIAAYLGNLNVTAPVLAAVAQITASPLTFASTVQGQPAALSQTINFSNTGNANLTISAVNLTSTSSDLQQDFSVVGSGQCGIGGVIAGGSSCSFTVNFTPKATGARSASLSVVHNVGTSTVTMQGTGSPIPTATINVTQPNPFPATVINSPAVIQDITISNSGTAPLVLSGINLTGATSGGFTVQSKAGNCTATSSLAQNTSCNITVAFAPTAVISYAAQLTVASNAVNAVNGNISFSLQGDGTAVPAPVITLSPTPVSFGDQTVGGTSGAQYVTVRNSGNAVANISSVAITGSTAFSIVNATTCPATLAALASCQLQLIFKPTVSGTNQTATLVLTNDATGSPHQVPISGNGVSTPTPSPTISQTAPFVFAATTAGQSSTALNVTIGNTSTATFSISKVEVLGLTPGDFTLGGACTVGKVITSATPCTMTVAFAPSAAGASSARVNVTTNGNTVLGFDVSGNANAIAVTSAQLSATTLDFANVTVGTLSSLQRLTLKNTGNQGLTINALSLPAPFKITTDSTTCKAVPFTLNANLQCDLTLSFEPTTATASNAMLQVTTINQGNNTAGPILNAAIGGVGVAPVVKETPVTSVPVVSSPTATNPTPTGTAPNVTSPATNAATTPTAAPSAVATVSAATPMNIGAGGCTASASGNDISMFLLLIGCSLVGTRRRLQAALSK